MSSILPRQLVSGYSFLYDWVVKRELNMPLEPTYAEGRAEDFALPQVRVEWWEQMVFKIITGLNLQLVRKMKLGHSPRFKQLASLRAQNSDKDQQRRANATVDLIRLDICFKNQTLESYWIDRELSVQITDLKILEETVKNYRITWAQGKNYHPQNTEFELLGTHPIETTVGENVRWRLRSPDPKLDYRSQYDEKTDTWCLVPDEQSVYQTAENWGKADRIVDNWIVMSLDKRLQEDKKHPGTQKYPLHFVRNEIYEERLQQLKERRLRIIAIAGLVMLALAGFFFTRASKGTKLI